MKKVYLIIAIMMLTLSACGGGGSTPTAIPTIVIESNNSNTPSSSQTNTGNSGGSVSAEAIVVPVNEVQLSFTNVGRVTSVNVNVGDKVNAEDVLIQLDTSILEAQVKEAEANLAYAEIQLEYLIRNVGCRTGCAPTEQHLEVAENDVARAQALFDSANAVLAAQSNLIAPFAGTIVAVNISPSETVTPGQVIIILGDLSAYQIETTDLSERDVHNVQINQPANVFVEALNQNVNGKVVDIARIADSLGGDVIYKVTIQLNEQPAGLLWGMSADVQIGE
ncbi:MAG: efflux RND transporter periplasmic adaptor subunit [Anaerolineales bacterium]|nr:efflux RND transporter periplasmic adaptor subunit [Anaerolineales bacterium]